MQKKDLKLCSILLLGIFTSCDKKEITPNIPDIPLEKEGYTIILNEEFNSGTINELDLHRTHWLIDENGWKESLTSIVDGKLILNAQILEEAELFEGKSYNNQDRAISLNQASGVIHSEGIHTLNEGFLEVKARFPKGGKNIFGSSIMIMSANWGEWSSGMGRFLANDGDEKYGKLFISNFTMFSPAESMYYATSPEQEATIDPISDFHTYGIEFSPGNITFYIDGKKTGSDEADWIRENSEVYFIISIMLEKDAEEPQRGMEVEYIRWYKKSE